MNTQSGFSTFDSHRGRITIAGINAHGWRAQTWDIDDALPFPILVDVYERPVHAPLDAVRRGRLSVAEQPRKAGEG